MPMRPVEKMTVAEREQLSKQYPGLNPYKMIKAKSIDELPDEYPNAKPDYSDYRHYHYGPDYGTDD